MKYLYSFIFLITTVVISANSNEEVNAVNGFIENKGQIVDMNGNLVPDVFFKIQTNNIDCYITKTGITYLFKKLHSDTFDIEKDNLIEWERIELKLKNVKIDSSQIIKEFESNQGVLNYYLGHCPEGVKNVKEYGKITIKNIYPHIDWVFYNSSENGFKYDFILHEGAKFSDIKLVYGSKNKAELLEDGSFTIQTQIGELIERAPISYYNNKLVKSKFKLESIKNEHSNSFSNIIYFDFDGLIPNIITDKELIIDPVLTWSCFYGGNFFDFLTSIATDSESNSILVGQSLSTDFPTLDGGGFFQSNGGYLGQSWGQIDCFILKFDKNGVRKWATYYGGEATETAYDVAIDNNDNIFFVGKTQSETFPTFDAGAYYLPYTTFWDRWQDCYIVKLSSTSDLLWATCFGGTSSDRAYTVTVDLNNNVYVGGRTESDDFLFKELPGAYNQATTSAIHNDDGFISKFSNQGNYLWGTPIGGSYSNFITSMNTDSQGNLFVLGVTRSFDYPLVDNGTYFQNLIGGNQINYWDNKRDLTILKFNPIGEMIWSTYYGSSGAEWDGSLVVDMEDNIYVHSGGGISNDVPLLDNGGYFENINTSGTNHNSILLKFDNNGEMLWGTAYSQGAVPLNYNYGTNNNLVVKKQLAVDQCTNHLYAYLYSYDNIKPLISNNSNSYQQNYAGHLDHYLMEFDENSNLVYASYLGGAEEDAFGCIATDISGGIWTGSIISIELGATSINPSIASTYPIVSGVGYSQPINQSPVLVNNIGIANQSEFFIARFTRENQSCEQENPEEPETPQEFEISLKLKIPNVFTPNGDDDNDVFKIMINGELVTENGELTIFNRWGNKVLSTNKEMKWDGLNNPSGVYYYIFKYNNEVFKGNISLFKGK